MQSLINFNELIFYKANRNKKGKSKALGKNLYDTSIKYKHQGENKTNSETEKGVSTVPPTANDSCQNVNETKINETKEPLMTAKFPKDEIETKNETIITIDFLSSFFDSPNNRNSKKPQFETHLFSNDQNNKMLKIDKQMPQHKKINLKKIEKTKLKNCKQSKDFKLLIKK
jgi:hypothetical protein